MKGENKAICFMGGILAFSIAWQWGDEIIRFITNASPIALIVLSISAFDIASLFAWSMILSNPRVGHGLKAGTLSGGILGLIVAVTIAVGGGVLFGPVAGVGSILAFILILLLGWGIGFLFGLFYEIIPTGRSLLKGLIFTLVLGILPILIFPILLLLMTVWGLLMGWAWDKWP